MLLVKLVTVFLFCQLAWLGPLKSLSFCCPGVSEQADYVPSPAQGCCAWPYGHDQLGQLRHCRRAHHLALSRLFFFHMLFMSLLLVRTLQCYLLAVWVEQHRHFCPPPSVMLTDIETNGRRKIRGCVSVLCKVQCCKILWNEMRWKKKKLNII